MTNYCNIRCSYCDWDMRKIKSLTCADLLVSRRNLQKIHNFASENFPEYPLVEYAGGEPFVYPELCEQILDIFKEKWVRFITNGTLIDKSILNTLKQHGRTILAISLDGSDIIQNEFRFRTNDNLFLKVTSAIDSAVSYEIPVMILCTLSKCNIDSFFEYVDWLENKYLTVIRNGFLVMPTHSVFSYTKDNGTPSLSQIEKFAKLLIDKADEYYLLSRIKRHYEILVEVMRNHRRVRPCGIFRWAISFHLRSSEIINGGHFHGFGCGMRGNYDLGVFDIGDANDMRRFENKIFSTQFDSIFFKTQGSYNRCQEYCFVDWVTVDEILSNEISLVDASEWFVLFRDPAIKRFIQNYRSANKIC